MSKVLPKAYFCMKCKYLHCYNSKIGQEHVLFNNDRKEKMLFCHSIRKGLYNIRDRGIAWRKP